MSEPVPEPTGYGATAAELRRIADALDALPTDLPQPHLVLSLLVGDDCHSEVDLVGERVVDRRGALQAGSPAIYYASRYATKSRFTVQCSVRDNRDAELERLRAKVAELEAAQGLDYSRTDGEPDDPTPVSPAGVPLHTGAVTDDGLVEVAPSGGILTTINADGLLVVRAMGEAPAEADPDACTCWATSRNGCPQHYVRTSEAR